MCTYDPIVIPTSLIHFVAVPRGLVVRFRSAGWQIRGVKFKVLWLLVVRAAFGSLVLGRRALLID